MCMCTYVYTHIYSTINYYFHLIKYEHLSVLGGFLHNHLNGCIAFQFVYDVQ